MNEQELKKLVENLVLQMVEADKPSGSGAKTGSGVKAEVAMDVSTGKEILAARGGIVSNSDLDLQEGCVDDITQIDLRKQLLVEHPMDKQGYLDMKAKTPARLGTGRAGTRYKTITALRVRADHAAAQDSVFSDVSQEFIKRNQFIFVKTMCKDKDEYLTRPDLGRKFDSAECEIIKKTYQDKPKVILVVGDGLSSAAIEANVEDTIPAIKQGLQMFGVSIGEILFIKYARVGAQDMIGDLTGAQVVCMLVGERPGLVTAESMSAYITYQPKVGIAEAKRNVISNIHKGGTPPVEAGAHIAELIKTMLDKKASGIDLKA